MDLHLKFTFSCNVWHSRHTATGNAPPLGYIVAYTPEQVHELMKDQYQAGQYGYSPNPSPKRLSGNVSTHFLCVKSCEVTIVKYDTTGEIQH